MVGRRPGAVATPPFRSRPIPSRRLSTCGANRRRGSGPPSRRPWRRPGETSPPPGHLPPALPLQDGQARPGEGGLSELRRRRRGTVRAGEADPAAPLVGALDVARPTGLRVGRFAAAPAQDEADPDGQRKQGVPSDLASDRFPTLALLNPSFVCLPERTAGARGNGVARAPGQEGSGRVVPSCRGRDSGFRWPGHWSLRVLKKATIAASSSGLRPRFPISAVFGLPENSGSGQHPAASASASV